MKFSRGHVGSLIENFRSPPGNLRAHNDIEFIFNSNNAETVKMQNTNCPWIFLCNATRHFYFVNIFVVHIQYCKLMYMITWTSLSLLHCSYYTCISIFANNQCSYIHLPLDSSRPLFWFLVVHRQHLVALASGRPVICNPGYHVKGLVIRNTHVKYESLPLMLLKL